MDPRGGGQFGDNASVHVVNKMPGGGKKKGPIKSNQNDQGATDKSSGVDGEGFQDWKKRLE